MFMRGMKGYMLVFLIIALLPLLISGCAAFKATTAEIREDPASFQAEAAQITTGVNAVAQPFGLPATVGVVLGYAMAFSRRLYVNWRKEEAKKREALASNQ